MRTTKQLLQLTLKEGNLNFTKGNPNRDLYENGYVGLCGFVQDLQNKHIITFEEFDTLDNFIKNNKPTPDSPHYHKNITWACYFWPEGKWAPRKRWLKYHVQNTE